jgi:hypothetical protein
VRQGGQGRGGTAKGGTARGSATNRTHPRCRGGGALALAVPRNDSSVRTGSGSSGPRDSGARPGPASGGTSGTARPLAAGSSAVAPSPAPVGPTPLARSPPGVEVSRALIRARLPGARGNGCGAARTRFRSELTRKLVAPQPSPSAEPEEPQRLAAFRPGAQALRTGNQRYAKCGRRPARLRATDPRAPGARNVRGTSNNLPGQFDSVPNWPGSLLQGRESAALACWGGGGWARGPGCEGRSHRSSHAARQASALTHAVPSPWRVAATGVAPRKRAPEQQSSWPVRFRSKCSGSQGAMGRGST